MSQTKRNQVLNHLDQEWELFLHKELRLAEQAYSNFSPPQGKDLKAEQKQGKKLSQLIKIWTQLKVLQVQKESAEQLKQLARHRHNKKECDKSEADWVKLHDRQLKQATKYIQAKQVYEKMF